MFTPVVSNLREKIYLEFRKIGGFNYGKVKLRDLKRIDTKNMPSEDK